MSKKTVTVIMALIFMGSLLSPALAQEKKKAKEPESKAKGLIILNQEKNYVKVLSDDYKTTTCYLDKKTKVSATIGAKISDLAKDQAKLPKGSVTYVVRGGKAVATKISYSSGLNWAIAKKKKKK